MLHFYFRISILICIVFPLVVLELPYLFNIYSKSGPMMSDYVKLSFYVITIVTLDAKIGYSIKGK